MKNNYFWGVTFKIKNGTKSTIGKKKGFVLLKDCEKRPTEKGKLSYFFQKSPLRNSQIDLRRKRIAGYLTAGGWNAKEEFCYYRIIVCDAFLFK